MPNRDANGEREGQGVSGPPPVLIQTMVASHVALRISQDPRLSVTYSIHLQGRPGRLEDIQDTLVGVVEEALQEALQLVYMRQAMEDFPNISPGDPPGSCKTISSD